MIKYDKDNVSICFEEIPSEISLGISISNCLGTCIGCHSPWLRSDMGEELTESTIDELILKNDGVTCILLLGEGNDKNALLKIIKYIKDKYPLKVALYSGRNEVEDEYYKILDYIKIGPYIAEYGPLNKKTTNQRLFKMENGEKIDITSRFWQRIP